MCASSESILEREIRSETNLFQKWFLHVQQPAIMLIYGNSFSPSNFINCIPHSKPFMILNLEINLVYRFSSLGMRFQITEI